MPFMGENESCGNIAPCVTESSELLKQEELSGSQLELSWTGCPGSASRTSACRWLVALGSIPKAPWPPSVLVQEASCSGFLLVCAVFSSLTSITLESTPQEENLGTCGLPLVAHCLSLGV